MVIVLSIWYLACGLSDCVAEILIVDRHRRGAGWVVAMAGASEEGWGGAVEREREKGHELQ